MDKQFLIQVPKQKVRWQLYTESRTSRISGLIPVSGIPDIRSNLPQTLLIQRPETFCYWTMLILKEQKIK